VNADRERILGACFAALRDGRRAEGLALAEQATTQLPDDARAHALLARALIAAGDPARAATAVDRALAIDPDSVAAWIERSALARIAGDGDALRAALERLVALAPGHAGFALDLARVHEGSGDLAAAEAVLDRALAAAPHDPRLRQARAAIRLRSGRAAEALADLEPLLTAGPGDPRLLALTGECLMRVGRAPAAVPLLERVAAAEPASWVAHDALLRALKLARAPTERILAQAERLGAIIGGGFGKALEAVERMAAAGLEAGVATIADAVARDPDHPMTIWLSMQLPGSLVHDDEAAEDAFLARWRDGLARLERLDMAAIDPTVAQAMLYAASAFHVHYLGQPLVEELSRLGGIVARLAARAAGSPPTAPPRADDGRIRVGIGTGMLRHHTVTKLFGALVRALPRDRFELSLVHTGAERDAVTAEFEAMADWCHHGGAALADLARAVRARDLDLLVWLDVGMETTGAALAALRLARVQAVLWGHPVTSGLPAIDWFLTSASMEPADAESHYRERLFRLPGLGTCYSPPPPGVERVPAEVAARDRAQVLAFMPQLVQKIRPRFDHALARIAAAAPELAFAMTPYFQPAPVARWRARLGRAFAARGLSLDDRVRLFRWLSQAEWLGLAREADFALDAFDWSGGNTSLEMFWYDTPIVTLPGRLMRARHTMAMLERMELPQLIARDEDDYVRIATTLALSADFRAEMRERIRERKHRLYEDRTVVEAFVGFCAQEGGPARQHRLAAANG
jgi:predicted O-linked N-acetylglucosamine transferase (SPINDLY family)/cytochrome c-type biogenesis protein CcmH/NrfG